MQKPNTTPSFRAIEAVGLASGEALQLLSEESPIRKQLVFSCAGGRTQWQEILR